MEITLTHYLHMIISAVIFILLWKVVGEGMMQPFFDLIAEREARTTGDEARAKEMAELSVQVAADIDAELLEARVEGVKLREDQLIVARQEAAKVTDAATEEGETKLAAGRSEIDKVANKARTELASEVDDLAQVLVARVLGQEQQKVLH